MDEKKKRSEESTMWRMRMRGMKRNERVGMWRKDRETGEVRGKLRRGGRGGGGEKENKERKKKKNQKEETKDEKNEREKERVKKRKRDGNTRTKICNRRV